MCVPTIKKEADLIAALSHVGRYLEYDFDENLNGYYVIWETPDGTWEKSKLIARVASIVAVPWVDEREYPHPDCGVWCSTWCLPEYWIWERAALTG